MKFNFGVRNQKYILNGFLMLIMSFMEGGILFLNYKIFYGDDLGSVYVKVAAIILLAWLGLMLGFYAWAIYFYNVNFGLTNENWEKIKRQKEEADKMVALGIEVPEQLLSQHPKENPYKDETFGLPPGTVRATIAITVLVAGISMLFVSFDPKAIAVVAVHEKYLEYFKTAFLMMIAFYFGTQSLKFFKSGDGEDQTPADTKKESNPVNSALSNTSTIQSSHFSENNTTGEESSHIAKAIVKQSVGKKITTLDVENCATKLGLEPAMVQAVLKVESSGSGFGSSGRPIILFEGHVFWRNLLKNGIDPTKYSTQYPSVLYPKWTKQFYSKSQSGEYTRLETAISIDRDSALKSASYGLFQILGENYKAAGFESVESFVDAQEESESKQLISFMNFIESQGLVQYLKNRNWREFAKRYNGPGYEANQYHIRLEEAYSAFVRKTNSSIQLKLKRTKSSDKETLGDLNVLNAERSIFTCKTLELPWKDNARNVSCIPVGTYKVVKRFSETYSYHFHIQDVPNRDWILIHSGNYYTDTKGCVLVGLNHVDINKDGVLDVTNSKETIKKLYQILPDQFTLEIS